MCKTSKAKNVHTPPPPFYLQTLIAPACSYSHKVNSIHHIIVYKSVGVIKMKCVEDKRQVLVRASVSEPQGVPLW